MTDARWTIIYETRARHDLRRLDPPVRARVVLAIERLAANPDDVPGVRRLAGRPERRLRVGEWRVLFGLDRATDRIDVQRILPRDRAYDR